MKKAPRNQSMAYAIIAASAPLLLFAISSSIIMPGVLESHLPGLLRIASLGCYGTAGVMFAHDWISKDPARRLKVAFENCGIYIQRDAGIRLPILRDRNALPAGWRLYYKVPIGLAKKHFDEKRDEIEAALDGEVSFCWQKGLLVVDVLQGTIPTEEVKYEMPKMKGEIMFPVGYGREGLITADLVSCPHLLVSGQTGGGKSNFIHQMVASVLQFFREKGEKVVVFILDLKRVEFEYLKKTAIVEHTLEGSIRVLEFLTAEMDRRKDFLAKEGFVNAKDWRKANKERIDDLPYMILVVDEFSQLCPHLAKEKGERDAKNYTHKMLVDLLSLARSLGIHVVLSTQYPHSDIIPGTLKQHLPATIAFKTRDEVGSKVCLGNNRAAHLPSPADIPGRAIWQHVDEREVQVMHLPMKEAKGLLPAAPPSSLSPSPSSSPGRFINRNKDTDF